MATEQRIAALEESILRLQAKTSAHAFVMQVAISNMLRSNPEAGRAIADLTRGKLTLGKLPESVSRPDLFQTIFEQAAREFAEVLIDPHAS